VSLQLILRQYGNDHGEVDIKELLSDAGKLPLNKFICFESYNVRPGVWQDEYTAADRRGDDHDGFYPQSGRQSPRGERQQQQRSRDDVRGKIDCYYLEPE
jgi:hypothetical protein